MNEQADDDSTDMTNDDMATRDDTKGDDMNTGLGVRERDLLERLLHNLPDSPPPRAVWERIAVQAEAEGLFAKRRALQGPWLAAGVGLAAALLVAVLWLPSLLPADGDGPFPTEPALDDGGPGASLSALRVRSAMLERNLRALPAAPRVMRAGTAATIGELEDRIAAIDHALSGPEGTLTAEETERYWRERVRLMDSLVQVRYAQARRNSL